MDCPFDENNPCNQSYIPNGPHNRTECIKAKPICPEGQIRVNGNRTADSRYSENGKCQKNQCINKM